ncbi:CDP-alcohol phosphatidyltransferase family protein [Magnetococcales bacterium HHB-1]
MNLPNFLSLLRICAVPVFIGFLVEGHHAWALWLFAFAGLTDGLDGFIAKRFGMVTTLGSYLDPLADKLLLISGFITLTVLGHLSIWLTLMMVTRDLLIIGGAVLYQLLTQSLRMEPLWISKINTFMQIILLLLVMVHLTYQIGGAWIDYFVWLTAMTTGASGIIYIIEWSRRALVVSDSS